MLTDLLTVAVLAWFGSRLVTATRQALRGDARAWSVDVVRGLRPRHFVGAVVAVAGVVGAFALLYQVPPLRIGWWTAIGGNGNPVFGSTERTRGTPLETIIP